MNSSTISENSQSYTIDQNTVTNEESSDDELSFSQNEETELELLQYSDNEPINNNNSFSSKKSFKSSEWQQHFTIEPNKQFKCKYCYQPKFYASSSSTSTRMRHIKKYHNKQLMNNQSLLN